MGSLASGSNENLIVKLEKHSEQIGKLKGKAVQCEGKQYNSAQRWYVGNGWPLSGPADKQRFAHRAAHGLPHDPRQSGRASNKSIN